MGVDMKTIKSNTQNQKGFATIEATVLIVLFVSLTYYSFGFFGIVHTGLIHNIHSRTYAFETFRHRANLMYFRSNRASDPLHYYNMESRLHGVNTDSTDYPQEQVATERPISFGKELEEEGRQGSIHTQDILYSGRVTASQRNTSIAVNPVWITTLYGICLDSDCGG